MRSIWIAILALAMPLGAFAQKAPTSTPAKVETAPQLTEVEQLKMENLELKIRAVIEEAQKQIQPVMQPLQQERAALVKQINAEHPGYEWYDARRQGETSGLRKIEQPRNELSPPAKK